MVKSTEENSGLLLGDRFVYVVSGLIILMLIICNMFWMKVFLTVKRGTSGQIQFDLVKIKYETIRIHYALHTH